MLKTKVNNQYRLVTQPDHGQLAGNLAAHWGNHAFSRAGEYGPVTNQELLREQVIFAIAQHDNGWIEWESEPHIAPDHLPEDLSEMVRDQNDGMNRWRTGLRRFPNAVFANLLISEHPRLLYQIRKDHDLEPSRVHPLFWRERPDTLLPGSETNVIAFIDELEAMQNQWREILGSQSETRQWIEPATFTPHARLLQILDGLSLGLTSSLIPPCSGKPLGLGRDSFELREVPRKDWDDLVTIKVQPGGHRSVVLDPYPFDLDPLFVRVPSHVFESDAVGEDSTWISRWYSAQPEMLEFRLSSPANLRM
ncbi:MAG: DUF3891 family protein [Verrucomicrobiales bacterium]|nr:DUF3891 family protein [Verrucomicrobiales bacterium]